MTNPAGSAIVNTVGPLWQIVRGEEQIKRRYLVILSGTVDALGAVVQTQVEYGATSPAVRLAAATHAATHTNG